MTDRNPRLGEHESPNSPKYWAERDCTKREMVNHPNHYNMGNPMYEPYKVIGEWGCNFNIGNAIKYLARYRQKWNPIEDLEKAKKYIDFEIDRLKSVGIAAEQERQYPINPCECKNSQKPLLNGNDLQNKEDESPSKWEKICRNGEKIVDEAINALDNGMSRYDVMRDVLKMSDSEISEVMKMNGLEDVYKKISDKIVNSIKSDDKEERTERRGRYFHY